MKKIITVAGIALVVGLAAFSTVFYSEDYVVTNERIVATTTEVVVEVKELDVRIEEAQEAARAEVEAKASAAYKAVLEEEMTAISDRVKQEYVAEIEATISAESY